MGITGLPTHFDSWQLMRDEHIQENLLSSDFTLDLYRQYKKHLGPIRFFILRQSQILVVPKKIKKLLGLGNTSVFASAIITYKLLRLLKVENYLKNMILPEAYKPQIAALDVA